MAGASTVQLIAKTRKRDDFHQETVRNNLKTKKKNTLIVLFWCIKKVYMELKYLTWVFAIFFMEE